MQKKWRAGAAAAVGMGLIILPGQAAGAETTAAPPGFSEAVALNVLDVVAIGHTEAKADQNGGESTGNALELGGEPLSGEFGGTQKGKGKSNGGLLDTGDTPLGRLAVTPWEAEVEGGANNKSRSDAALAKLILIDSGTLTLNVLHTQSQAEHSGQKSKGRTNSDGARLVLGDGALTLVLLHSETSSEANGNQSYVVGINDNLILSSDQAGGSCAIAVPGVAEIGCLNAGGGIGTASAAVADGTVLGENPIKVSAGTSAFGDAPAAVLPIDVARDPEPAAVDAGPKGLASTGAAHLVEGAAYGVTLILLGGVAVLAAANRRRTLVPASR